jgi:methionine-rich copper-binding protein CopC
MKSIFMAFAVMLFASSAWAHDGVALEKDFCTVQAGPYAVHFSAYQRYGEEQEACDDILKTGATVFGLTPVDSAARDLPLGLKLVDEQGGIVFAVEPKTNTNGIVTVERDVPAAGKYKVVVTVLDKTGHAFTGEKAVTIGLATFWNQIEYILYAIGFVGLMAALRWALTHNREPGLHPAE